jgi:deoxyribodipyrimidine photolyase-related protein
VTQTRLRRWLFADQLGPHFLDFDDQPVLLVEARSVFRRRSFHRQKAHLVLSALRHRAAELGDRARFHQGETYREALDAAGEPVSVCAPTSWAADRFVRGLEGVEVLPARGFTLSRRGFSSWADGEAGFCSRTSTASSGAATPYSWTGASRSPDAGTTTQTTGNGRRAA